MGLVVGEVELSRKSELQGRRQRVGESDGDDALVVHLSANNGITARRILGGNSEISASASNL